MAHLSDAEKIDLKRMGASAKFREDMAFVEAHRHNPFVVNGKVAADTVISFLTEFNAFINHEPRPFKRIEDSGMLL
jgi:hypothetical protein